LLVQELGEPLFSSTLMLPGEDEALTDPYEIKDKLEHEVDLVIGAGFVPFEQTTIIEFSNGTGEIIRQGKGLAPMLAG
jgi:tRNA A37 threonylcarbamoyladenosine synthetase subunit TsaC/SUA5/YrdC